MQQDYTSKLETLTNETTSTIHQYETKLTALQSWEKDLEHRSATARELQMASIQIEQQRARSRDEISAMQADFTRRMEVDSAKLAARERAVRGQEARIKGLEEGKKVRLFWDEITRWHGAWMEHG